MMFFGKIFSKKLKFNEARARLNILMDEIIEGVSSDTTGDMDLSERLKIIETIRKAKDALNEMDENR